MDGNTVAPDATNASKRGQSLLFWPQKAIVLWLAVLLGAVVAGKIVPIDFYRLSRMGCLQPAGLGWR